MAEHPHKIDLTTSAWVKLTIPGLILCAGMLAAGVRYADKVDRHEAAIERQGEVNEKFAEDQRRLAEALAKVEERTARK